MSTIQAYDDKNTQKPVQDTTLAVDTGKCHPWAIPFELRLEIYHHALTASPQ